MINLKKYTHVLNSRCIHVRTVNCDEHFPVPPSATLLPISNYIYQQIYCACLHTSADTCRSKIKTNTKANTD